MTLQISGQLVTFLVDSGAAESVVYNDLNPKIELSGRSMKSKGATGNIIKKKILFHW